MTDLKKPDLSKDTTGKSVFVLWSDDGECFVYAPSALNQARAHMRDPLFAAKALLQLEVDDQGVPVHGSVVRRVG